MTMDDFSKWAQKRTVECMKATHSDEEAGMRQYYHGMVEAFAEAELALKKTKLDHEHECYWKDRLNQLEELVDLWVPADLKAKIKKEMRGE